MRPDLYITVEAFAGSDIRHIADEMIALANRMQVVVECKCNGVTMMARPGDDAGASDHKHKFASDRGFV